MQHGASLLVSGLLASALLISLAAAPGSAEETGQANPDVVGLEAKVEQLQRDMEEMRRQLEKAQQQPARPEVSEREDTEDELERLRRLAEDETPPAEEQEEELPTETSFIARGLGLQALNPELSLTGDFLMLFLAQEGERSEMDFRFRVLGIHFESYLDPYSKMKAAVEVHSDGAELGEAYYTRFGILPGLNFTAGKFRQQFGVVNRWHKHALDQTDFPLALRQIFGDDGLNQTGVSFEWNLPEVWDASHRVFVQVTNAENPRVFGQNSRHLPSVLARYQHYRDLSKNTYLDIGLTGLTGWNDDWATEATAGEHVPKDRRQAWVAGGDITIRWEPTDRMRYAYFESRTEFYYLDKGIVAPDGSGRDRIRAWGAYTYLQRQISRTLELGVRVDYFEPDSKTYGSLEDPWEVAVNGSAPKQWQIGPYITWWQSPWVKFRFEVTYADRYLDHSRFGPGELTCALQLIFAAGPHKHERY